MSKYTTLIGSTAIAMAMLATPAYAQIEDEIIVTATKRETTLQDTPVAVTVTSADVIEKARILDLKDLQSVVPTLRVSQLQNSANTSLSIRGFANGSNNLGIEPSVGLFIDGVYRSRAAAAINDLPVLERIEVLSGPQSTLFGKNASAGVVSISTAKPSYETTGYIEAGYGNYNLMTAKGYVSTGIADNAAVSLGGGFQTRDGYAEITSLNEDINDLGRFNLRGQVLVEPTDTISWRVIADYSEIDESCCIVATGIEGATAPVVRLLGGETNNVNDPFGYETVLNRNTPNKYQDWGVSAQGDYDLDFATLTSITAFRKNEGGFDESDSDFTTIRLLENVYQDVEINTFTQELRLTSNPGDLPFDWMVGGYYFNEDIVQESGASYGPQARPYVNTLLLGLTQGQVSLGSLEAAIPNLAPGSSYADGQGSDERFTQDNEAYSVFGTVDFSVTDRLTLTGGLNYTKDKKDVVGSANITDEFSSLDFLGADGAAFVAAGVFVNGQDPIPGLVPNGIPSLAMFLPSIGVAPTPANIQALRSGTFAGAAQQAGFNQYAAGVGQFAAGAAASGALSDIAAIQFFTPFLGFPNAVESGQTKDDDLTWTVKAAYEVNDNINLFASAATGFKASSWALTRNSRPFASSRAAIDSNGLTQSNPSFGTRFAGPEETTVYELGMKTRFEKGAFNITAFDQTIEGFQSTIFAGTAFVLNNAGEQSVRGFEFDATYKPVDALTFNLGGAYLDAKYDEFLNAGVPEGSAIDLADGTEDGVGDLSGETPAGIPEFALSLAATYTFTVSDNVEGFLRADYQWEDEVTIVDNLPANVTREVNTINAALGFEWDSGMSVQAWVRNLNNDEYFGSGFPTPAQAGSFSYYPNQPRTYGVVLRKEF
ncbi:TonB-dependent receptor [Litorimonas sp. RW-G-Af-16]|uniref:TonB-dependent receptor n=1 Tax=Litorimonas sp. RW-G-Af-16 TaxID=3241168 RepID=UPI00390C8BBB